MLRVLKRIRSIYLMLAVCLLASLLSVRPVKADSVTGSGGSSAELSSNGNSTDISGGTDQPENREKSEPFQINTSDLASAGSAAADNTDGAKSVSEGNKQDVSEKNEQDASEENEKIWSPLLKSDPVLMIGDSYLTGVNKDKKNSITEQNWGKVASDILDLTNVDYVSESGAGFAQKGYKGNTFQDLLDKSYSGQNKKTHRLVIIAGGYNDVWCSSDSILEKAAEFFNALKSYDPDARVVLSMIGENAGSESVKNKLHQIVEPAYRKAAETAGIDYISGGADVLNSDEEYFCNDGLHPNDDGYDKIGVFIARGIRDDFQDDGTIKIRYHRNANSGDSRTVTEKVSAGSAVRTYFDYPWLDQTGWSLSESSGTVDYNAGALLGDAWIEENAPVLDLYAVWEISDSVDRIIPYDGAWYYVKDGKIQTDVTGIARSAADGNWYFVRNGKLDWSYTGIAKSEADGRWYFVRNGKLDWSFTGIAQSITTKKWYFVRNGRVDWSYTGIAQSIATKKWYYVRKGEVNWNYTGFSRSIANNLYYYVYKGELDWNFTGIAYREDDRKWCFARKGAYDDSFTGIARSIATRKWYFVRKGMVDWGYTGIAKSIATNKWYYVRKGELDWNYTGLSKSIANNLYYYVYKGELDWNFTGIAYRENDRKWCFVRKGAYDGSYTGIARSIATKKWYFVRKGTVDWNYTGIARSIANNRLYYVRRGEVDWNYSGPGVFYENKKVYRVVKGSVV